MKTARLIKTAPSGTRSPQEEVVLVCSQEEAKILFDALDLYCTEHPNAASGKYLYHALGWNGQDYFPERTPVARATKERKS